MPSVRRPASPLSRRVVARRSGWPVRWLALSVLTIGLAACTSPKVRRDAIDEISSRWNEQLEVDEQEEVLEHVAELGELNPGKAQALVSVVSLARQAHPQGNPSALVRVDALRAAWKLASIHPGEPLRADSLTPAEFSESTRRFEALSADPERHADVERIELARFMSRYRFPPGEEDLALSLAETVVTRGAFTREGPVRDVFIAESPGCARHALVLVTLRLADDSLAWVREESLRQARHMHPGPALDLIAGAFRIEEDMQVLLAAMDSLEYLSEEGRATRQELGTVLALAPLPASFVLKRRAEALQERLDS